MKNLNKTIFSLLSVVMMSVIFVFCGMTASAETTTGTYGDLNYSITDGEVKITGYANMIEGDLVIPDTIDGYPVTSIGNGAFDLCSKMTSVVIPDSIKNIEENAFYTCSSLKSAVLPVGLTEIPFGMFGDCWNLEKITIPDNVTAIGGSAFTSCHSLSEVNIPEGVVSIGDGAFSGTALESIDLPDGLTSIGEHAFANCYKLKAIDFPDGIEEIADYALKNCFSLESVTLPANLKSIGQTSFAACYSLEEITLPYGLELIDKYAFSECISLEKISIPASVTLVSDAAFGVCNSLKSITVNNSKTELGELVFAYTAYDIIVENSVYAQAWIDCYDEGIFIKDEEGNRIGIEEYPSLDTDGLLIECSAYKTVDDVIIYGYAGSSAETYADENDLEFVALKCQSHKYSEDFVVVNAPTYSQSGLMGKVCEYCGDAIETYEIPMLEIEDSEEKEDADTGVSVIFPEDTFGGKAEIEVTPIGEGDAYALVGHKHGKDKVTMFDINVTVDGEKVQPNGTVLVKIPLPKGYDHSRCAVYYVAEDGTTERLKTFCNKDGYIYFETDHFSFYAVIEEEIQSDGAAWMDESLTVLDKIIEFVNKIIAWFKSIFGIG